MSAKLTTSLLTGVFAAAVGCSAASEGPGERTASLGCDPGGFVPCACANGSSGMQQCASDGMSLGACAGCGMSSMTAGEGLPQPPTSPLMSGDSAVTDPAQSDPSLPAATEPDPVEPAPVEPNPVEPDPLEPAPVDPAPVEPAPVEPDPVLPPPNPDQNEVPVTDHCAPVSNWDPLWAQWEEEVLLLVNERRAAGANCDTEGTFGPAGPLIMNAELRCAARLHSMDMALRGFFDHVTPEGVSPSTRIAEAGYSGNGWGENIAAGQGSPQEVVDGWMDSDGHCSNIMQGFFTNIGVGYYLDESASQFGSGSYRHYWTQNFGS